MGRISKVVQIFPNMTNHLIREMQKIGMRVSLYMYKSSLCANPPKPLTSKTGFGQAKIMKEYV
jgi:hypothetical protein